MKFLHLADTHIGKIINGVPMLAEQRHAFKQIIRYVETERPAAVVIAGDIYDRASPSVEAVSLFDDFLTELAQRKVSVLLIAGNHDSPERLSYAGRLLMDKGLFLCGAFNGEIREVILNDEYGVVRFWLLPFIKPSSVRGLWAGREAENYGDAVAAALLGAGVDYAARNVLVSHQFYVRAGVSSLRSDSELNPAGGLDAIDARLLEGFDYVALGHLHRAQSLGEPRIRYAGSPVKYSFSEWRQGKSVTLAELGPKGSLAVSSLPLAPLRDMREVKGKLAELLSAVSTADANDYLRVVLTDEEEIIDPVGKLRSVYPNLMSLDFENSRTSFEAGLPAAEAGAKLSPYEMFSEFFLETQGSTMSGEQARIARELLEAEE